MNGLDNFMVLTGRLTKAPKVGQGKVKYAFYTLAINKKNKTIYVPVSAFGTEADYAEANLTKGTLIQIVGEPDTDKDGKMIVIVNSQALKGTVMYKRNTNSDNVDKGYSNVEQVFDKVVDKEFTPVLPGEDDGDVPF